MGDHATGHQIDALGAADPMETGYEGDDDDDMASLPTTKQAATKQQPPEQPHSVGSTPRYGDERISNDLSATLISPPPGAVVSAQPQQAQAQQSQQPQRPQSQQQRALAPLTTQASVAGPSRPVGLPRGATPPTVRREAGLGFDLSPSNERLTHVVGLGTQGKRAAENTNLGASVQRANKRAARGDGVAVVATANAQAQAEQQAEAEDDALLTQARDLYKHKDPRIQEIGRLILTNAALQLVFGYWLTEKPANDTEAALSQLLGGAHLFAKKHRAIHIVFNSNERAQSASAWTKQMPLTQPHDAAM